MPDEVVAMTTKPGATRPSFKFALRRRVVRIAFDGGYRDIMLEERQIYGDGAFGWVDKIMWPFIWWALGFACAVIFTAPFVLR